MHVEYKFSKIGKLVKKLDKIVYKLSVNNPSTVMDYVATTNSSNIQLQDHTKLQDSKIAAKVFSLESTAKQ